MFLVRKNVKKVVEKSAEKFGGKEKSRTFALPFEKNTSQRLKEVH